MGLRPYAREAADWIFGSSDQGDTGILRDTRQGEGAFDFGKGLDSIGLYDLLRQSGLAGSMGRTLAADSTNAGLGFAGGIMGTGNNLMGMIPGMLDASNYYLGKGNDALGQYQTLMQQGQADLGSARQVLSNVMNPTAYNPIYQGAVDRQTNSIDSMLAARGMVSSGPGLQAEAANNLSNQFGERQFQEQIAALGQLQQGQGMLGQLATGYGNLSGTLAQLPSSIWNSTLGGVVGMAPLAGLPQSIVGTGMDLFRAGTSLPLETIQDIYNITRGPQLAGGQLISTSN